MWAKAITTKPNAGRHETIGSERGSGVSSGAATVDIRSVGTPNAGGYVIDVNARSGRFDA
jgi:hypothetical protein